MKYKKTLEKLKNKGQLDRKARLDRVYKRILDPARVNMDKAISILLHKTKNTIRGKAVHELLRSGRALLIPWRFRMYLLLGQLLSGMLAHSLHSEGTIEKYRHFS